MSKKNITELRAGNWCKICNKEDSDKKYYNYYKNIVELNGGTIISKKYIDSSISIKYICENGHTISTKPSSLKAGGWCNICNKDRLLNKGGKLKMYEEVKQLIEKNGGTIISEEYVNASIPIKFKCENGHIRNKTRYELKRDGWCSECNKLKTKNQKYEFYKQLIENKGGILISKKYGDSMEPLEFRSIAKQNGGLLLSKSYLGFSRKYEFRCKKNHTFKLTPQQFKNNRWCPTCK